MKSKDNLVSESISPYIDSFMGCSTYLSYFGKDLLEASNMPEKSSFLFKQVVNDLIINFKEFSSAWSSAEEHSVTIFISDRIRDFSKFVFMDEHRANYFTEKIITKLHSCLQNHEITAKEDKL